MISSHLDDLHVEAPQVETARRLARERRSDRSERRVAAGARQCKQMHSSSGRRAASACCVNIY
eukprot:5727805-Pleurochrysis_carterae.AAC.2